MVPAARRQCSLETDGIAQSRGAIRSGSQHRHLLALMAVTSSSSAPAVGKLDTTGWEDEDIEHHDACKALGVLDEFWHPEEEFKCKKGKSARKALKRGRRSANADSRAARCMHVGCRACCAASRGCSVPAARIDREMQRVQQGNHALLPRLHEPESDRSS